MQNINRIQNVTINASANIIDAMVVVGTNAHRAYLSLKPCDPSLGKKGSGSGASSSEQKMFEHSQKCSPQMHQRIAAAGNYAAVGTWRLQSRFSPMPAGIVAAHEFSRPQSD
jgi:hypothetical protein